MRQTFTRVNRLCQAAKRYNSFIRNETLWKAKKTSFIITTRVREDLQRTAKLNPIRTFRNRIYHYEPIIWDSEVLDQKHNDILDVLYWLNPETAEWVRSIDT